MHTRIFRSEYIPNFVLEEFSRKKETPLIHWNSGVFWLRGRICSSTYNLSGSVTANQSGRHKVMTGYSRNYLIETANADIVDLEAAARITNERTPPPVTPNNTASGFRTRFSTPWTRPCP